MRFSRVYLHSLTRKYFRISSKFLLLKNMEWSYYIHLTFKNDVNVHDDQLH